MSMIVTKKWRRHETQRGHGPPRLCGGCGQFQSLLVKKSPDKYEVKTEWCGNHLIMASLSVEYLSWWQHWWHVQLSFRTMMRYSLKLKVVLWWSMLGWHKNQLVNTSVTIAASPSVCLLICSYSCEMSHLKHIAYPFRIMSSERKLLRRNVMRYSLRPRHPWARVQTRPPALSQAQTLKKPDPGTSRSGEVSDLQF